MIPTVANYDTERRVLFALFGPTCQCRIVFLEGPTDVGKTHLLDWLRPQLPVDALMALVDLDRPGEIQSAELVLSTIADQVAGDGFHRLRASAATRRPRAASIDNVHLLGDNNVVTALAADSEEDKAVLRHHLLTAFLDDLGRTARDDTPLIIALDGCHGLNSVMTDWVCSSLVPRLGAMQHVRIIVCSRDPLVTKVKKAPYSQTFALSGVSDVGEWRKVFAAERRVLPEEPADVFVSGVIAGSGGCPGRITRWMATLPLSEE